MLRELGYCTGIENYSRVISGRPVGSPPLTLIDYFPKDFLLFVDESHVTLPQVPAMYNGDSARKESLVEYGFRLPCAFDNRPLKFDEFEQRVHQRIYVSATPGDYEKDRAGQIVEQVIRPTGLLDPKVEVRPVENQIDDLVGEINARSARNERVLVTTLTKKMAEDLTQYLTGVGIRVRYMHADVETIERMELIRGLRLGEFDVLVGINLLREGLDIPEVSMVAILDADKEGFLRSETSLIQTIGRAARNADGLVVLYADTITPSMRRAMDETERRRQIQDDYNKAHGIIPQTIRKDVREIIEISKKDEESARRRGKRKLSERERDEEIRKLEKQMQEASRMLEFEYFSAFVFKIQANMNKAHRDRIAFMRICSGKFERDHEYLHVQGGKTLKLAQPQQLMAQERAIINEAYAGDIIGVFDPGIFSIGDTICDPKLRVRFEGIPTFAPEHFSVISQVDTMKRKQFVKGVTQIAQEGAIQIFHEPNSGMEEVIVGAVGVLQFEVLEYRLKNEYNIDIRRRDLSYSYIRWITSEGTDPTALNLASDTKWVQDFRGHNLLIFNNEWSIRWAEQKNPGLTLAEFSTNQDDEA